MYRKIFILLLLLTLTSCTITLPSPNKDNDNKDLVSDTNSEGNVSPNVPGNENTDTEKYAYLGSDDDIYRINITTKRGKFPDSLDEYVIGALNITEQNTSIVIHDTMGMSIKLRGNSTSGAVKKPFKIKFDQGQSLFGLESAKDWVLLANYFDKTDVRNYLAYTMANKLDTLGFQPSSIFVDVYINNEYQGLYMLTEQMEANEGRVDIENIVSSTGISSFFIEADWRALTELEGYEGTGYILLGGYALRFRYPDAKDYIEALNNNNEEYINEYLKNISWAKKFLISAYNAIKSNDFNTIEEYIDVDSFIDYYLIQELFKNVDAGGTSQYYVIKQDGKNTRLSCGPVWDFDISCGVIDDSQSDIYTTYTNTELHVKNVDTFYSLLLNNNEFEARVKARYQEIKDVLYEVFDDITNIKKALSKAQSRNISKWPFPSNRLSWIEIYGMSTHYFNLKSTSAHYRYLKETLLERFEILDKYYG